MYKLISHVVKEILQMAEKDQQLRKSPEAKPEEISKWDKIHKVKIKKIIDKYGLISTSKFGKEASFNTWLLIQHFPESEVGYMEKYLNLMEQNIGEVDVKNYAYLTDRINLYRKIPQIYGTQAVPDGSDGTLTIYKTFDIKNVDKRRAQVNLEPLSEYVKRFEDTGNKICLPPGYKINSKSP